MGAAPLQADREGDDADPPLERYAFPDLAEREGADLSWADAMDALRAPRQPDQKPWDWRRASPIRPVVFEDPGTMDGDVVHLHLEHRLVQRLLGRFTAQGFVHHDLSRACLAHTSDAIPRVILIGRLCLYGPGAARLHEELVPVAARWLEPTQRKEGLKPYASEAASKTMDLLEAALSPSGARPVPDIVTEKLRRSGPQDVAELLPHLEARGRQLADDAAARLRERGEKEAKAMHDILTSQQKRVEETAARYAGRNIQAELQFDEAEVRQLEANRRHWAKRLDAIDRELEMEPGRIRDLYEIQAQRIEPIGLAYLWPITG